MAGQRWRPAGAEGRLVSGIVLLVLIGLGVAWVVTRGRQKMKLPVTGRHWLWIVIAVVVVLASRLRRERARIATLDASSP